MGNLDAAIDTPAGKLTPGKRYNLTLKHGDAQCHCDQFPEPHSHDRELKRAKIVAFEHTDIGVPGGGKKPGDIIPSEVKVAYRVEAADQVIGFVPEDVLKAVEA